MATDVFPFNVEGKKAYEDQFKVMFQHLGDGVLNDTTGSGCKLTATGSSRTVTLQAGDFKVAGFVRSSTDTVDFDASALGTQPTSGQTRINVAVMRLDLPNKTITPTLLTGAPSSSAPVRPTLTNTATVRDVPFCAYVDSPNATTASAVASGDERSWIGPDLLLAAMAPLPDAALGTTARRGGVVWRRALIGTSPAWLLDSPFVNLVGVATGARSMVAQVRVAPVGGLWGMNLSATFSGVLYSGVTAVGDLVPVAVSVVDQNVANYRWRFARVDGGDLPGTFDVLVHIDGVPA